MKLAYLFPVVFLGSYGLGLMVGCSSAQKRVEDHVLDAAGKLCPVIVQSTDPSLDPLCVDYDVLATLLKAGPLNPDTVYTAVAKAQGAPDAGQDGAVK